MKQINLQTLMILLHTTMEAGSANPTSHVYDVVTRAIAIKEMREFLEDSVVGSDGIVSSGEKEALTRILEASAK